MKFKSTTLTFFYYLLFSIGWIQPITSIIWFTKLFIEWNKYKNYNEYELYTYLPSETHNTESTSMTPMIDLPYLSKLYTSLSILLASIYCIFINIFALYINETNQ